MIKALVLLLCISVPVFAAETAENITETDDYRLTVEDGLISLNATDASLRDIMEDIAIGLDIRIEAYTPVEDTVTVQFEELSLQEAIGRLSKNYMYEFDVSNGTRRVIAVIIVPEASNISRREIMNTEEDASDAGEAAENGNTKDAVAAEGEAGNGASEEGSESFNELIDSANDKHDEP